MRSCIVFPGFKSRMALSLSLSILTKKRNVLFFGLKTNGTAHGFPARSKTFSYKELPISVLAKSLAFARGNYGIGVFVRIYAAYNLI